MKTYRISDDLTIVRYGNKLRFEVGMHVIDDIDADDISKILVEILKVQKIGGTHTWSKTCSSETQKLSMRFKGVDTVEIFVLDLQSAPANVVDAVMLSEPWLHLKLFNVLSMLLPRLCEEGL